MFKIHSVIHVFKISRLKSIREYDRVLQNVTECYRVVKGVTECYRVLQSITEYYKILQSISSASTWTNFWACLLLKRIFFAVNWQKNTFYQFPFIWCILAKCTQNSKLYCSLQVSRGSELKSNLAIIWY